jgi:hypothetical protein
MEHDCIREKKSGGKQGKQGNCFPGKQGNSTSENKRETRKQGNSNSQNLRETGKQGNTSFPQNLEHWFSVFNAF